MRNRVRIFSLFLSAMLLGGCSLAVEDGVADKEQDRMIGAYITQEVIGTEQFSNEYPPDCQNRLYALIEKNGSKEPSDWNISFPGSEGIRFFAPFWNAPPDGHSYRDNVVDAKIGERDFSVSESDDEESIGLAGTIYVLPYGKPEKSFHFYVNPVYQTPDGEFYALPGSGYLLQTGGETEGEQVVTTLSDEISQTVDGKMKSKKTNVTIKFQTVHRPVKMTLCEMDVEHQVLKKQAYQPQELPGTLHVQAETAYILVETEKESPSGETEVSREICENTQQSGGVLESFCAAEDGILVKRNTEIVWGKK